MSEEYEQNETKNIAHLCKRAAKFELIKNRDEEYALIAKAQSGEKIDSKKAYSELVDRNLRLVIKIAGRFTGKGLPLEDLVQEGIMGLMHSVYKFDFTKKTRLSTYATQWIEQKIRRAIDNKARLVRISGSKLQKITTLKKLYKKLVEDENCPPTSDVLADLLGITKDEAEELGRLITPHTSLDAEIGDEGNLTLLDYVEQAGEPFDQLVETSQDKGVVKDLLDKLPPEDAYFIRLKFGFFDGKERRSKELADIFKITLKEVKEREEYLLTKLRLMSDPKQFNSDIYVDVYVVNAPIDPKTFEFSEKLSNVLKVRAKMSTDQVKRLAGCLPFKLFRSITQHLAKDLEMSLVEAGATVQIIPQNTDDED